MSIKIAAPLNPEVDDARTLADFVTATCIRATVYPPQHAFFSALNCGSLHPTKAAILDQERYHGPG